MPVLVDGKPVSAGAEAPGSWCVNSTPHTPMRHQLAIRVDADNLDHHLWLNHGTWWIHYTLHLDGTRKRRVRCSLETNDVEEARTRRDRLFAALGCSQQGAAARGGTMQLEWNASRSIEGQLTRG